MRKVLFFLMIVLPACLHAQDRYVEVTLEDSIQIEPDEIYFTVMLQGEDASTDTVLDVGNRPNQLVDTGNRIEKINQLIKEMNIEAMDPQQLGIAGQNYQYINPIKVLKFSSKEKLAEFI